MTIKKNFYKQTKWWLPLFLLIFLAGTTITGKDSAFSNVAASSAENNHPIKIVKDLRYSEEENSFLDIYYPDTSAENLPVILWIHGGGYIGGSKESRQEYGMALAAKGYVVANMDYGLAPEHTYPTPIFQANAALAYLQLHAADYGGDMTRVFIGGDSAGAQIASQMAAVLSNEKLSRAMKLQPAIQTGQMRGAILFCGLYNMETVRATEFPNIELFLTAYTNVEPFESFAQIDELSTVNHVTTNYPPVFITVGDADPFSSQSTELVEVLKSHNVPVSSAFFEGTYKNLAHEYQYALDTVDAQQTFEKTLDFLSLNSN